MNKVAHNPDLAPPAVLVSREGPIASVVINLPPYNHVGVGLLRTLADAFDELDADETCRVITMASEGRVFCGGAELTSPSPSEGAALASSSSVGPFYAQAIRLFSNRKPIVAAVQGAAVGAGLGLALLADFRVAAEEARFAANFVKLGFHPGFGLSHTLPRLIGPQRAALMLQTGRRIKSEEALAWGLVDEITSLSHLRTRAMEWALELAGNAPLAVQSTRATLRRGLPSEVRRRLEREYAEQIRLSATADFREGGQAVAERRDGVFSGR